MSEAYEEGGDKQDRQYQTSYHLGAGIDAAQRGKELSYYHKDEQLSTAFLTGSNGDVQNVYLFDAFGMGLEVQELFPNRIRYTGQQYDGLTGQYYLRARYYNPVYGRFMQEDVYQGDGLNLYAYCDSNPVVYCDPSGYNKCGGQAETENTDEKTRMEQTTQGNVEGGSTSKITNKFPSEAMPQDGKIIDYYIENGRIKGIEGINNVDFVITTDNTLIIGNKHHYIGNGQDVLAAGQLKINGQGQIRRIDNLSGHYRPTVDEAMRYQSLFENLGLDLNNTWLEYYRIDIDADGMVIDKHLDYVKMLGGKE